MKRPSDPFGHWRGRGLSTRAANVLVRLSCETVMDVKRLGQERLRQELGVGPPTFNEIAKLTGWQPMPPRAANRRRA